jgi:hypothetical protein
MGHWHANMSLRLSRSSCGVRVRVKRDVEPSASPRPPGAGAGVQVSGSDQAVASHLWGGDTRQSGRAPGGDQRVVMTVERAAHDVAGVLEAVWGVAVAVARPSVLCEREQSIKNSAKPQKANGLVVHARYFSGSEATR